VINRYLGYWDANPATLMPLSPQDSAPLYVEMMGGPTKIMKKAKQLYNQGKHREATEILNELVYAQPNNVAAKNLLAAVYEQIGYQKESPSVRNSFLGAAYELRRGMPAGTPPKSSGPDTIRGMSTDLWVNYLGIRLDSSKADGLKFVINLITPDNLIKAGKATFVGDRKPFDQLRGLLVKFTPDFELLPGTKPTKAVSPVPKDPFAVGETGDTRGG